MRSVRAHEPKARVRRSAKALPTVVGVSVGVVLLASVTFAVSVGPVPISFRTSGHILASHVIPWIDRGRWSPVDDQIVWDFRTPRVLLACLVGAGLACTGATLQALVRNPLADPYVLGVSAGASLGAVVVLILGAHAVGGASLSTSAFIGAMVSLIVVYLLGQVRGQLVAGRLILAGVALSYLLSAVTTYLIFQSPDPNGTRTALFWLLGTLGATKWSDLSIAVVVVLAGCTVLSTMARSFNAMLLGDEAAVGLGVNLNRLKTTSFLIASLITGVLVSVSGAIGFVGLLVPHAVRLMVGSDHRRVFPLSAAVGAGFLVWADLLARVVVQPSEMPLGVITGLVGAPWFLLILLRRSPRTDILP
jgi:iron complex transport system permease protein